MISIPNRITGKKNIGFSCLGWLLFFVSTFLLLIQIEWQSYIAGWRCEHIAAQLRDQFDLVVRYTDPSEFFVPPQPPATDYPELSLSITPTDSCSALNALLGVRKALAKYPKDLLHTKLDAVFIGGIIKSDGFNIGGTYFFSWIYLSADPNFEPLESLVYEKLFHHELSSLLMDMDEFPYRKWSDVNNSDFSYLTGFDVLLAAKPENRQPLDNVLLWYLAGFVSDYGMANIENDFNTYAELAMTEPEKLKRLAEQYPRIKAKTRILIDFYSSLAPELAAYFKKCGLTESVVK